MKVILKKEVKGHFLLFLITVLISAFFQITTILGFYINVKMYKPLRINTLSKDQIELLLNMLKLFSEPKNVFATSFYAGSTVVVIAMIVLGVSIWDSEIKNHTAEFLFSSGMSHRKIVLAKFVSGSVIVGVITLVLCAVSAAMTSVVYSKVPDFTSFAVQIGIVPPRSFNPGGLFIFKAAAMYFLGAELIFAISFVFAFIFLKKAWVQKAVIPFVIYLIWGVFWNMLFGYPNSVTKKFHKGILLSSKWLWKFSFNSLYFSQQATKPFEIAFGASIAFAVLCILNFFLLNMFEKIDKV